MASDEELARRVVRGDESALEELLERYDRPLASFISRHTGGHEVEDLYQETWIRVVGAIDSFDPQRKFSSWLFRIAINLCRDFHRRRNARPTADLDSAEVGYSDDATASLEMQSLLTQLPIEQREAVLLRYYHDLSEAEMVEVTGVPKGTVKSRLHAGLRKLSLLAAGQEGST